MSILHGISTQELVQNLVRSGIISKYAYLGSLSSVLGHSKHVGPGNGLSGHLFSFLSPFGTIQYQCDTSRDVIRCHDFGPTAPLRRQNLKTLYVDFPGSLIIVPKYAGPRSILYGLMHSIS